YIRASELAEELCVNKSAITVKIEKLEAKGFILRQRDKDDRRNIYLSLTEKGQIIYEQGEAKIESFVSKYLEKLDPKDFEAFIDLYEKILSIIQDHKEETNV
ncbi:MarR family winged helix-turn-helix transcriptional regulator, partial [Heyndrickxia sporothermodurans]